MSEIRRVIESHTLYSAQLCEERTMKVFVPPGYSETKRYPVLYAHDGAEFFSHGRIATIAERMILNGELPPFLIVGITISHGFRTADYALDGKRNVSYRQFVLQEALPFIEQAYATDHSRRAMAGISLGASVSLQLFFDQPDLFSHLLLFSGAFAQTIQRTVDNVTDLSHLHAWMLAGTAETAVVTDSGIHNFLAANQTMRSSLVQRGAQVLYTEAEGQHLWGFWQRHIPAALSWLLS